MLSPEEGERLRQIREELHTLSAEIGILTERASAAPDAGLDLERLEAEKTEKEALLAALSAYIAKRVELSFARLSMNRVAISLRGDENHRRGEEHLPVHL